jgi:hypothetical protein
MDPFKDYFAMKLVRRAPLTINLSFCEVLDIYIYIYIYTHTLGMYYAIFLLYKITKNTRTNVKDKGIITSHRS